MEFRSDQCKALRPNERTKNILVKKRRQRRHKNNMIPQADIEKALGMTGTKYLYTSEPDSDPDEEYEVRILDLGQGQVIKLSNTLREIKGEWEALSFLKSSGQYISSFIEQVELFELNGRQGIKMPKMVDLTKFSRESKFEERMHVYAQQVMRQLYWIHKIGVIHADIKEDNIMYNPSTDELCLIDFGLSERIDKVIKSEQKIKDLYDYTRTLDIDHEICTSFHRAPECFSNRSLNKYIQWEKDVESLEKKIIDSLDQKLYKQFKVLDNQINDGGSDFDRELLEELVKHDDPQVVKVNQEKLNKLDSLEKERDKIYKAMKTGRTRLLEKKIDELKDNCPKAIDLFERHCKESLGECPYAFKCHVTISADVYALGLVFEEFFDFSDQDQEEFVLGMLDPDIRTRKTSRDMFDLEVFDRPE